MEGRNLHNFGESDGNINLHKSGRTDFDKWIILSFGRIHRNSKRIEKLPAKSRRNSFF